jgi:hypothetical protein
MEEHTVDQAVATPQEPEVNTPQEPEVNTPQEPEVNKPQESDVNTPQELAVSTPPNPEIKKPRARERMDGLGSTATRKLLAVLQSDDRKHDAATKESLRRAFNPMEVASINDAKATIKMSDDDGYSVLSKCKIGSAVMLPYILNPVWKVSYTRHHKQMFMLTIVKGWLRQQSTIG